MTYRPVDVIEVRAWERQVGAVARNPATDCYAFEYSPDWIRGGIELAPFTMPLSPSSFEFPDLRPETYHRLPPMLADALPDAFGNALVTAWMAEQGIEASAITPLDRLAYAADRAMGALEFRPPANDPTGAPPTALQLADLVQAARLTVRREFASGETARLALQQLIQVGTSAGGARAKAVVSYNPGTDQVRSAYGEQPDGFEQWIIKLDGVAGTGMDGHDDGLGESAPYGRIEYAYALMAARAGIEMTECRLLAEGPRRHFMTRRFDRLPEGVRLHVASLCALRSLDFNLVATHSYDQYLQAVLALELGPDALREAFRRMAFNVAAVNRDDHTKNFAFLCDRSGTWSLAPAFDVTHAYRADSHWTSRHFLSVNGRFEGITIADLHEVGERNGVSGYRNVVRDVLAATADFSEFAALGDVPEEVAARIVDDLARFRPA